MDELSLVIPAKQEPNSLPVVIKELDKLNLNKIIVLKENDKETIESVKNLNCEIIFQSVWVMEMQYVKEYQKLKLNILQFIMQMDLQTLNI